MVTVVLVVGIIILAAMMIYFFISAAKSPADHRDSGRDNSLDSGGNWAGDSHHFHDSGGSDSGSDSD